MKSDEELINYYLRNAFNELENANIRNPNLPKDIFNSIKYLIPMVNHVSAAELISREFIKSIEF